MAFGKFLETSKISGKWSEIFGKWSNTSLSVCQYNKQKNTWLLVDHVCNICCRVQLSLNLARSLRSLVRYRVDNSNSYSKSTPTNVLSSICELIECSRPIRFFIVSLMYNNTNCRCIWKIMVHNKKLIFQQILKIFLAI